MVDTERGAAAAAGGVEESAAEEWPLRPWVLAALLGSAGLLVYFAGDWSGPDFAPWRAALTALVFFGPIAAGFTLNRGTWKSPAIFSLIVGAVMAGIAWRVASADKYYDSAGFWLAAGIVASALALPLFQAGFHRHRWTTSYKETHYHAWTDTITAGGALAFTGLSWLVLALLSELFQAIKIDLLHDLIDEGWFGWTFSGVAFGAALGVLRNQLKVIGTLQNVVLLVFSLIAVPLAVALVLFLLAVLLSGINVLWDATRSATPLLLALAAGSLVLVNAVLRDDDAAASGSRIMRIAALVLALGVLPLSILAAISMGTRIAQHGLSPERIWGLVAIVIAVLYGVAYFVSAIRSRKLGWHALRQANLHLAVASCVVALLLAMPILDFGAISTRNQLARLEAGAVSAEDFDYEALRWDFGEAGRAALARLSERDGPVGERAAKAAAQKERTYRYGNTSPDEFTGTLRVQPDNPELHARLTDYLGSTPWLCRGYCVALDLGTDADGRQNVAVVHDGGWRKILLDEAGVPESPASPEAPLPALGSDSTVELREETKRYIFVDGQRYGQPVD